MKQKSIAQEYAQLNQAFEDAFDALTDRVREQLVIPFCDRHGMRFTAGNGSWSFDRGGKLDRYSREVCYASWWGYADLEHVLGKRLCEALHIEYSQSTSLGDLVQDYTPQNYVKA